MAQAQLDLPTTAAPQHGGAQPGAALPVLGRRFVALRVVFGLVWAIDAYLKWQPSFARGFSSTIAAGAQGQPAWLLPWFHYWQRLVKDAPHLFAYLGAATETLLAIGLILGLGRRVLYVAGALWSLAIWSIPEGFGTPFAPGATDIGTAIRYAILFGALYMLERAVTPRRWTLDTFIQHRLSWWRWIGQPGRHALADLSMPPPSEALGTPAAHHVSARRSG